MSSVGFARAAYDYISDYPEDVTLKAGDVVQVLQRVDDSWLKGKNRNKVGYFPVTYVEPLQLPPVDHGQKLFLSTRAFHGEVNGDLSFEVGNIVVGLEQVDENWWKGVFDSITGIFPLTHVIELNYLNIWSQLGHTTVAVTPQIVGATATAIRDLRAQLDDELSFVCGDRINILHDLGDGFAIGSIGDRIGQFPLSFVKVINASSESEVIHELNTKASETSPTASVKNSSGKGWKKSHARKSSYTLLNTRSLDTSVAAYCSTLYPFAGNAASGELSFEAGEIVHLLSHVNEEWLYGQLDNRYGIFPASYVDIIVDCTTADEPPAISSSKGEIPKSPEEIYGRILYDFHPAAGSADEIDVCEGDTVTVLQKCGPHWLEVRHDDGRIGLCPTAYVELFGEEPCPSMIAETKSPSVSVSKPKPAVKPRSVSVSQKPGAVALPKQPGSIRAAGQFEHGTGHADGVAGSSGFKSPLVGQWKVASDIRPTLNELMKSSHSANGSALSSRNASATAINSFHMPPAEKPAAAVHSDISALVSEDSLGGVGQPSVPPHSTVSQPTKPAMPPRPPVHRLPRMVQNASLNSRQDLIQFSPDGDPSGVQATAALQTGFESLDGGLQKQQEARNKIITELYQTEMDYCSCLELCVATFYDEVSSPWSAYDKETLFGSIKSVVTLSRQLISRLEVDVIQKPFAEQNVGLCFIELKADIQKVYAPYCRNHDTVIAVLEKYENNDEMMAFINQKLSLMRQQMTVFDLSSILIKPVQRILKYPLLLSELLKATDENHCDKPHLAASVAAMTEVAAAINEYKRRKDLVLKYKRETEGKFTDKIGRLSVHSTKKKFFRISQKMSGIQTVDERFNAEEQRFKLLECAIRTLIQDVTSYIDQLEDALSCAEQVAGSIRDFHNEKSSGVDELCASHSSIAAKLFSQFKTDVERDVEPPLSGLLLMFQGPSNVIRKRHDKLLDFDNASKRLGSVKENDHITSANEELVTAKANYEALNAQLLDDLPKLFMYSMDIIHDVLCRLFHLQAAFYSQALDSLYSCLGLKFVLGATVLPQNIIEQFNVAHASVVEQISSLSVIPSTFNPRADEIRKAKPRLSTFTDEPESVQQSDEQKSRLMKTYGPERLFTVTQDITGSQLYDLTLKKGSQVGVVKEGDPMGNRDRWFVDNGSTKGFVLKHFLTRSRLHADQQHDLLSWSDPIPASSKRSTSILEDTSWSQQLVCLLDPPLKPTASAAAQCLATDGRLGALSDGNTIQRPASCSSWEKFSDDVFDTTSPSISVILDTSSKDSSFAANITTLTEARKDGANNKRCRVLYSFTARDSSEVSLLEGTFVTVLQRRDLDGNADWWLVVASDGRTGYAPASYLELSS